MSYIFLFSAQNGFFGCLQFSEEVLSCVLVFIGTHFSSGVTSITNRCLIFAGLVACISADCYEIKLYVHTVYTVSMCVSTLISCQNTQVHRNKYLRFYALSLEAWWSQIMKSLFQNCEFQFSSQH